jgi:microcystin-dependent protein
MATAHTPNLGLPYPDESSPADVPVDLQALALALDALPNLFFFAPGDLKPSASANPPAGWLLCDGSAVSRTGYAALYQAIGVAFGAGDGNTTFNLPDYRGRALVGAGQGTGLSARALGSKFGEEAHALSVAELPSHNHAGVTGADSPDHTHSGQTGVESAAHNHNTTSTFSSACTTGPAGFLSVSGTTTTGTENQQHSHAFGTGGASARHTHAIPAQGGGAAHNVVQPSATAAVRRRHPRRRPGGGPNVAT